MSLQTYEAECSAFARTLEVRKPWFLSHGMTNFLLAVSKKLGGRVDVGLAWGVVHAYMMLELSNAVSETIPR